MNANAPSSPPPKYPILKLIPLTTDQCASELGCTADDKNVLPQEHQQQQDERTTMALKLCNESADIFDVDNYSPSQTIEPTRYAKYDDNGNYSCEMKLGRSVHAKIKWTMISRALLDIGMTRAARRKNDMNDISSSDDDGDDGSVVTAWIKMRKEEEQHRVHLNGKLITAQVGKQIAVNDGTILSLYGPTCYAYRISIQSNGATINPSSSLSTSSSSKKRGADSLVQADDDTANNNNNDDKNANNSKRMKLQGVKKDAHQLFENESECPLCHELLVKTVALHPCGHSFCGECAETYLKTNATSFTECPSCRSEIRGFTRNRTVDTMIWAAALTGTFDRDDASNYLTRMEQAGERVATEEEKECILRCGDGEHHEDIMNGGGSQMNGLVFMDPQTSATKKVTHVPTLAPLYPSSSTTLRHGQTKAKTSSIRNNQVVDLTL